MSPPAATSRMFRLATRLARSPLHPPLAWLSSRLGRYMDVAQNANNCDFGSNGEGYLMARGAPHWKVALDLGANLGDWALTVNNLSPGCRVHCFEPSPRTVRTLRANLAGRDNLVVHHLGVGDREGMLAFHDYGDGSVASSFLSREGSTGERAEQVVDVPISTLDAFLDAQGVGSVDYAKIDTEGYEMPILRGAQRSLSSGRIRALQFEYGGTWLDAGESLRNASRLFAELHWTLYRLLPDGLSPLRYDHRRDETFKYSNYVAVGDPTVLDAWGVKVFE